MSTSLTLPATTLREAEELAAREGRTVSGLLQDAVRRYLHQSQRHELQDYGRQQSGKLGVAEADVERLVHEYRQEASQTHAGGDPV